jgi:hypothetical protein
MVFDIYGVFRLPFVFGFADDEVPLKMTALGWDSIGMDGYSDSR